VQRRAQRRENKITEDSVKLCQVGIERVQRVHKKNSISSSETREVSRRKTLTELLNTLLAQQGVLEQEVSRRASNSPLKGETRVESLRGLSK
jgi:hypothetical protein